MKPLCSSSAFGSPTATKMGETWQRANHVGIYISAAGFSQQAAREARSQEKRRLKMIDLEDFVELWVQNMQRLPDQDRRRLPLKPVYFLASGPE